MNKVSRLAALLLAVLLFAFAGCALAEEGGDVVYPGGTEMNFSNDEINDAVSEAISNLYNTLLSLTTLQDMYDNMFTNTNWELLNAMNAEQLQGLYNHANDIFYAIENPTEDEIDLHRDITDTFLIIAEGMDVELFATEIPTSGSYVLNGDVTLTQTVTLNGNLTITGSGTIKRGTNFKGNMFDVPNGYTLAIGSDTSSITISGENIDGTTGRVINATGALTLINTVITKNMGGGINITGSNTSAIKISGGEISYCKSTGGSAIYLSNAGSSSVNLTDVEIHHNETADTDNTRDNGGTIRTNGNGKWKLTVSGCDIHDNASNNDLYDIENVTEYATKEGGHGGAIYWNAAGEGSVLTINNNTLIYNNTATCKGGGLFLEGKTMNIESVEIYNNHAYYGGGISLNTYRGGETSNMDSTLNLSAGVTVHNNTSISHGAGFAYLVYKSQYLGDGYEYKLNINGAKFHNNIATEHGGAIAVLNDYPYDSETKKGYKLSTTMNSGTIRSNSAINGGGIFVDGGSFTMLGGLIGKDEIGAGNSATNGAGVYVDDGDFTMTSGTMDGNTATNIGGAAYVSGGIVTIGAKNCSEHVHPVLKNNSAANGGAVAVAGSTPIMYCGEMSNNVAKTNGGAVYVTNGGFTMDDGTVSSNRATVGGAVYVSGGAFTMNDGEMTGNGKNGNTVVAENGGAVYVNDGSFTMNDGKIDSNEAAVNGGAVYVNGGAFTINAGTISNNEAITGGAAYVKGGTFTMTDGTMSDNEAINGGAVYADGGNVVMTSGIMSGNVVKEVTSGAAEEGTEGYGGAIFANGGNVTIGVENCTGLNQNPKLEKHNVSGYTDKEHPIITSNSAVFGGALAVRGNGKVEIYCSKISGNTAANDGTGMNVFMDSEDASIDHYLDNADIGTDTNHGMVSIGGQLTIHHGVDAQFTVTITYDSNYNNEKVTDVEWTGTAPENYYLNLPYCPTSWVTTQGQAELTFVGWADTELGTVASEIREVPDYMPIGTPVKLIDQTPETTDKDMKFFAVWAPKKNTINYRYSLDGETIETDALEYNGPNHYEFSMVGGQVLIGTPTMSGYAFLGWRLYAEDEKISNWDADAKEYEPDVIADIKTYADYATYNGTTDYKGFIGADNYLMNNTLITEQNFGELTLVAVFEPMFSTLKITKDVSGVLEENASFLFHVTGTPDDDGLGYNTNNPYSMYVTVNGIGTTTIEEIPVGDYTVTEISDWSWRYNSPAAVNLDIINPDVDYEAKFTNTRNKSKWLDGEAAAEENQFTIVEAGN